MNIDQFFTDTTAGINLEDKAAFYELDRLLRGKPEVVSGSLIITQAEPPSWMQAFELAKSLLVESKDIRIAVGLARCLMVLDGLSGLAIGFEILRKLIEDYWGSVYPIPYEDEPDNFLDRTNALAVMNDHEETIIYFRNIKLLKNNKGFVLTPRMLCIAAGKVTHREGEQQWTMEQLQQAVNESDLDDVISICEFISSTLGSISAIRKKFDENAFSDNLDFRNLVAELTFVSSFFERSRASVIANGHLESNDRVLEVTHEKDFSASSLNPVSVTKQHQSRSDVIKTLEDLCVFMEKTEPAHPASLFMRRAQRLLSMNFMEIVKDMMPDSLDAVNHFKGQGSSDEEY